MTWQRTYRGRFHPLSPNPAEVDILDIARSLSMQCRWLGHVKFFMSIAEHSLLVAALVTPPFKLAALLHDSPEYVMGDIPGPLKAHLPDYDKLYKGVEEAIQIRFNVFTPFNHQIIKDADLQARATEKAQLLEPDPWTWEDLPPPLTYPLHGWPPAVAERKFLAAFLSLTSENN